MAIALCGNLIVLSRGHPLHWERPQLTRREHEILTLVAAGHPNHAICDILRVAEQNVRFQLMRVELRNATCGTKPFESRPTWGGPKPKPLLHEPGPTKMSSFRSATGIPVAKGDRLRLNAVYDNSAPHTRAMGIMM